MTRLVSGLIIAFVSANSIAAVPKMCAIAGEAIHWQADYCLYEVGTDDIIAADPCLDREAKKVFRNACKEKAHYKRLICERIIQDGSRSGTVRSCVRDRTFFGPTVRNGGA